MALLADRFLAGIAPSDLRVVTSNAAFESVKLQQPIGHVPEPVSDDRELDLANQQNELGTSHAIALLVVAPISKRRKLSKKLLFCQSACRSQTKNAWCWTH